MTGTAYDWNAVMGGFGQPAGLGLASRLMAGASTPPPADFSWAVPNQATTPAPADTGGGSWLMQLLRGKKDAPGDGITGWLGNSKNLGAAAEGIGALTGAWLGHQQMRIAKDQLNFQKGAWQKNFGNSVKTYNTSLEDRIRGRTADYAGKEGNVQAYLARHRLGG